jgi:hypothetical protein
MLGLSRHWKLVPNLAHGSLGLSNLRYVELTIMPRCNYEWCTGCTEDRISAVRRWMNRHHAQYIRFGCAGRIIFFIPAKPVGYITADVQCQMKIMLNFKLTFMEDEDPKNEL